MDISFPDRRKHPRVVLTSPVEIKNKTRSYQGLIRNISLSGIGVESNEELRVGEKYAFKFSPSGIVSIKTQGIVRWRSEQENKKVYGIEFKNSNLITRIKIAHLIKKLTNNK